MISRELDWFSKVLPELPIEALLQQSVDTTDRTLLPILGKGRAETLAEFAALISPHALGKIENLARHAQHLTQSHFGKVIRLFAPIYLSNECINICKYCGFSRDNQIPRITIPVEQVENETRKLAAQGFRSILIVAGEHPKYVSNGYVAECIRRSLSIIPSIAIELGPMKTDAYIPIVEAGCEGLVVYQETYHHPTYKAMHPAGPKKKFAWRLDTPQRAYEAGFRRLGIGALLGLYDWRYEAIAAAAHTKHLLRHCWKAQISISVPRLRPAAGGFESDRRLAVSDREFAQYICALRMYLRHASITLSTREAPSLRNGMVSLGITNMSAGSSTEPGGYSHFDETTWTADRQQPGEQFHIADERPPQQVAEMIRSQGYEPVWKDFDRSLLAYV